MKYNSVIVSIVLFFITSSNGYICERTPKKAEEPRPNINKYVIEIVGGPESYTPGEKYKVVLKSVPSNIVPSFFTEFMIVVEPENPHEAIKDVQSGDLRPLDYNVAKFTDKCPNAIIHVNTLSKSDVELEWKAPPSGNGCVAFRATVFEAIDSWYTDDGGLTKILCEEEENADVQPEVLPECSVCNEAKYEVSFQGMWTRNTHPKDYPRDMWKTKLGEVIGASHSYSKSFWNYESTASVGMKLLAEQGNTSLLEEELKEMVRNDDIRTIIKAKELSYPNITGTSYTVFRVDQQHHLISLVSKITPSPDWVIGVANLELCTSDGWIKSRSLNLYPWDIGTDDGNTYADSVPNDDPKSIQKITSSDEDTPFYSEDGEPLKPIAKLRVTRQKLYERACEPVEEEDKCQMTEWSEWSNCTTTCGGRVRTRDRQLVHPENDAECTEQGPLQETSSDFCQEENEECEETPCAKAEWSQWSECNVTCGEGIKTRNGTVPIQENEEEEREESEEHQCFEVVTCYQTQCGDTTSDDNISHMSFESQVVVQGPSGRVVNCQVSKWSDWGACTATERCTTGYQYKERHIERHPSNGGKACPKRLQKHKRCKAPCGDEKRKEDNRHGVKDCIMGPWKTWSPCTSNCGSSAVQIRTRDIIQYPSRGGRECGPRLEQKKCPLPYACNDRESFFLNKF